MIRFIENQTIEFRQEDEQDCGCSGKRYCQLVEITDTTEFQLLGSIANINPSFNDSITGWGQWNGVELELAVLNATTGNCDGQITATASEGSGGYQYAIDNGAYSGTNVFTGLCPGSYVIKVKDSDGNQMAVIAYVYDNIDCSLFECTTLQDLIDSENLFGNTLNCIPIIQWSCLELIGDFTCLDSNTLSGFNVGVSIGDLLVINGNEYEVTSLGFFSIDVTPSDLPVGDTVQVYKYI